MRFSGTKLLTEFFTGTFVTISFVAQFCANVSVSFYFSFKMGFKYRHVRFESKSLIGTTITFDSEFYRNSSRLGVDGLRLYLCSSIPVFLELLVCPGVSCWQEC